MNRVLSLLAHEARAYGRCAYGLARYGQFRTPLRSERGAIAVFLVHGVAADGSQFHPLAQALAPAVDGFAAFEYRSGRDLAGLLAAMRAELRAIEHAQVIAVGHSLGGLLLSRLLQGDDPPPNVRGLVTICAPLAGTTRCNYLPGSLGRLSTRDPQFAELRATRARLNHFEDRLVTIGVRHDWLIRPAASAFLDGFPQLLLEDRGHVSALFDARTHAVVREVVGRVRRFT